MLAYLPLILALQASEDVRDYQKYYDEDRAAAVSTPLLSGCFGRPGSSACIDRAWKACIGPYEQQLAMNICAYVERGIVYKWSLERAPTPSARSAFIAWERRRRDRCERTSFFMPDGSGYPADVDLCVIRAMYARASGTAYARAEIKK